MASLENRLNSIKAKITQRNADLKTFLTDNDIIVEDSASMGDMLEPINNGEIQPGVDLPELTNPATASEVLLDYEVIDENGEIIVGSIATYTGDFELIGEGTGGNVIYISSSAPTSDIGNDGDFYIQRG